MNWDDLRYLLAIERRRTLAAAARELGVTKATASRRLAALEASMGARLVERRPSGLVLTSAGRAVVEAAQAIESTVTSVEQRVEGSSDVHPRGVVRLTAPQWLADRVLIPELFELRRRYPELEVDLIGTNKFLNLAEHEADLAVRNVKPTQSSLKTRRIGDFGGCVYASSEYLSRRGRPASAAEVSQHDVLVYETLGGIPGYEWMHDPERVGRIAFRANDAMGLLTAASAGLGLAALPCMLGDLEPSLERVAALGLSRCDVFLVAPADVSRTARVRAVSEFVVEVFTKHRALIAG